MERTFRYFKLAPAARIILSAGLYAACVFLQIGLGFTFGGLLLAIPAWILLSVRNISNKPADLGLEEWRAVGDSEITRIADTIKESKKMRTKFSGPNGLKILALIVIGVIMLINVDSNPHVSLVFLDLIVFLIPGLFFGGVKIFIPGDLDMKLPGFLALMNAERPADMVLTPYLRFDQDKEKRDIPEDVRFMLEPRRKPADLVGIQFQMAINNGANGKVPYLYAVVLTKGKTGYVHQAFTGMSSDGYEVEEGGDDDYGTVVIRQSTEGGGYHTTPKDCVRLLKLVLAACAQILAKAA